MDRKQVGLVVSGLVGGLVIASLVYWHVSAKVPLASGAAGEATSQLAERDRLIAALRSELETVRSSEGAASSPMACLAPPAAEQDLQLVRENLQSMREMDRRIRPDKQQRESERLVAGGFSRERIGWIQQRREELEAQQEQFWKDQKDKGQPIDINLASAYMYDPDLDLRKEMGDDEYTKYRQALGRPIGIGVLQVQPDTSAAIAGIKLGDQIVAYGGKRVYNVYMLNGLVAESSSGGVVAVDVLRNGQTIQLVLPGGPLPGLVGETPAQALVRSAREDVLAQQSRRVVQ